MNNRVIFPQLKLFKKEITERFLVATREIYKQHPVYLYDEDESKSGILIYPSYGDVKRPGVQPKLVVKAGSYQYSLMDTFSNNMTMEAKNSAGVIAGYTKSQIIPIQLAVIAQAYAEEESSDIADELAQLVVDACRRMYSQVGIVIRGVNVSETDLVNKEESTYQTVVSISMDIPWSSTAVSNEPPIDSVDPEIDDDFPRFETYRSPGVDIHKGKL